MAVENGSPAGINDLARILAASQHQPTETHVLVPAGPDGAHVQMPWQAALIWELDQLRMLATALLQRETPNVG